MPKNKVGTCRLCLNERLLADSHIISEVFYQSTYEENRRYTVYSANPDERTYTRQKGIWECLLCSDACEQKIARWERYVANLFFAEKRIVFTGQQHYCQIDNVDYAKSKLFQMSVLWRSAITSRLEFAEVNLPDKHTERLRTMLLNEDPGRHYEYGCAVVAPNEFPRDLIRRTVDMPEMIKLYSHHLYRYFFGGMFWFMYVSSHMNELVGKAPFSILEDDRLILYRGGRDSTTLIYEVIQAFRKAGKVP